MRRIAVVANPVADADQLVELRRHLRGGEVTWLETTESDPGVGQAREAVATGAELVIVCGGDGTVRACAEGLVDSNVPLAIVPAGTGNLLALNLGIPDAVDEAIEIALDGPTHRVDTGQISGETFVVMAGLGLDAVIMDETASEQKTKLGTLAYILEGLKHLDDAAFPASVTRDSNSPREGAWATVLFGNYGRLQAGVDIFPDASPTDGRLDMIAIGGDTTIDRIWSALTAATGSESANITRAAGKRFEIVTRNPVRYELDGEARSPVTEFEVSTRPHSLLVRGDRDSG